MSVFYDDMALVAETLLAEFGATAALRVVPVAYTDPASGIVEPSASIDLPCFALRTRYNERYNAGAVIQAGDEFWVVSEPAALDDWLLVGSASMKIVQSWPVSPDGGSHLVTFLQVRS